MVSYSCLCIYCEWPKRLQKIQVVSVLAAGFLIHFTLGSLSTYGNIIPYIVSYIRQRSHPQSLRYTDAAVLVATQIAGQGMSMAVGGWLEKKFGPRMVSLFGGWFMSLGVYLSYVTIKQSFWLLLITYGLMYGIGIGIVYISPVSCAMRWLPKWKGLASGIVVAGFGLSAFIFNVVQTLFINFHNRAPDSAPYKDSPNEKYFTQSEVLDRVPAVFLLLGSVYAIIQLIASVFLVNPTPLSSNSNDDSSTIEMTETTSDKEDKNEPGDSNKGNIKEALSSLKDSLLYLLKKPNFYIFWLMFICVGLVLMFIAAVYKTFGFEEVTSDDHFLTIVGSASSVVTFIGRFLWGLLVDFTDYKFSFLLQGTVMTCLLSTLYAAGAAGGKYLYFLWICGIYFCVGGYFTIFPVATIQSFGPDNVSLNYGLLGTALATGAIIGSLVSQWLAAALQWYGTFFVITGFHILELFLVLLIKRQD